MNYSIDSSSVRPAIFSSNVVGKVITLSWPPFIQILKWCQHMEPARIRQQRIPHHRTLSLKRPLHPRLHHGYPQQVLDTYGAQSNSRWHRSRTSVFWKLVKFNWRFWCWGSFQGNNGRDPDKRFLDEAQLRWCVSPPQTMEQSAYESINSRGVDFSLRTFKPAGRKIVSLVLSWWKDTDDLFSLRRIAIR